MLQLVHHCARRSLCVRAAASGDVWIERVSASAGVYRMGATTALAESLGGIGFVDVPTAGGGGDLLLPGRPFAMVEGPCGMRTLESPVTGFVVASNTSLVDDDPAQAGGGAQDTAASWIVEVEMESGDVSDEFEPLPAAET